MNTPEKIRTRLTSIILVMVVASMVSVEAYGQGRATIRNAITGWGGCRNVAITRTNGDLALNGRNSYAGSALPSLLREAINELKNDGRYIDDIQLTEDGSWLILWGDNGLRWYDIPPSLKRKLEEYNEDDEVINSVTFNDDGDWILIGDTRYTSSDGWISDWLEEGSERHGELWAACVTDDAIVAVYARGYKFFGNVPQSLKNALNKTSLNVYRLKIAGTSWFFADKDGSYQYDM